MEVDEREALLRKLRELNEAARAELAARDSPPIPDRHEGNEDSEDNEDVLLDPQAEALPAGPIKLVAGIEDKLYFQWQLALLCESLAGKLPPGCELMIAVCNDHQALSPELEHIVSSYGIRCFTADDLPRHHRIDFAGGGEGYPATNKIEALRAVAPRIAATDRVCLMDTDVFLYGAFDPEIFPEGDGICRSWIVEEERFLEHKPEAGSIDLRLLLSAIGIDREIPRGSATIFFRGETIQNPKFVPDCYRFSQVLYLLSRVLGMQDVWISEMPSYSLAFATHDVDATLVDTDSFVVDDREQVAEGSFFHYYLGTDEQGAFRDSPWKKQNYFNKDLLDDDLDALLQAAVTDHERYFFETALKARARLRP